MAGHILNCAPFPTTEMPTAMKKRRRKQWWSSIEPYSTLGTRQHSFSPGEDGRSCSLSLQQFSTLAGSAASWLHLKAIALRTTFPETAGRFFCLLLLQQFSALSLASHTENCWRASSKEELSAASTTVIPVAQPVLLAASVLRVE